MEKGYTFTKPNTVKIKWKINEVSSYLNKKNNKTNVLESLVFSEGSKIGDKWQFKLYLNHNCTPDTLDGNSWIYLYNMNSAIKHKIEFFILNSKQEEVLIGETQVRSDWKFVGVRIFKDSKLSENISKFTCNDVLTFYCKIPVADETITIPYENLCTLSNNNLLTDLAKMYESKDYSDVTITVKDTEFQAHKSILSIRSPVLAAMFAHDMIEKKSNEVFIPDIDPEIFEKVLQYIYTDQVKDLNLVADRVLEAADKYQILSLKEICENLLIKSLTRENVIETVVLADRYNAKNLKDYAIKCIIADAADIMKTVEFKQLNKTSLSLAWELLRKIILEKIENEATINLTT